MTVLFWRIPVWPVFEMQKTRSTKELRSPKCLLSKCLSHKVQIQSIKNLSDLPRSLNYHYWISSFLKTVFLCIPHSVHLLRAQQCGVCLLSPSACQYLFETYVNQNCCLYEDAFYSSYISFSALSYCFENKNIDFLW